MSVLNRGIKMPENCETCEYQTKGACFAFGVNKGTITIRRMDKDRPDWCPLAEIKSPHGDLIDADKLMRDINKYHVSDGKFQHWVEVQPIVIEAEGK